MKLETFEADITDEAKKIGLHAKVWAHWQSLSDISGSISAQNEQSEAGEAQDPDNYRLIMQQVVNMHMSLGEQRQVLALLLALDEKAIDAPVPAELEEAVFDGAVERNHLLGMNSSHMPIFKVFVDVRRKVLKLHPWRSGPDTSDLQVADVDIELIERSRTLLRQKE